MNFWVFRNLIVTTVTVTRGRDYLFLYKSFERPEQFVSHAVGILVETEISTHLHRSEVRAVRAVVPFGNRDVHAAEYLRVSLFCDGWNRLDEGVMIFLVTSEHTLVVLTNLCNTVAVQDSLYIHAQIRVGF